MPDKARKITAINNPISLKTKPGINVGNFEDYMYRKNIMALEKYYPELAELIKQTPINNRFEIVIRGKNEYINLLEKASNALFYNADDPLKDVEQQINALYLKNTRMAIFLGMGLGLELIYFVTSLLQQQRTTFILVIEKDPEIFKAALYVHDWTGLIADSKVRLIVGQPEELLYTMIRAALKEDSRFILLKALNPVYHSSSLRLNKEYYINALKIFRDVATQLVLYYGNDPYDSLLGIENMLSNLTEIISNPGINLLFNQFKNRPAIVVSTGPSLNKNKEMLKGLEDKALIIAADASLKILMAMGVKPHLVTSLERVRQVAQLVDGFTADEVDDVYFAACPVIYNETYQAYAGPRIIVYRNFDHFKWLGIDRGILEIQLSAGNMAFKIAEALGCNPIILIGQDLAFSRDGRTHAAGAVLGETQKHLLNQKQYGQIEVVGNDGMPITTNSVFYSFLKAYETDVAAYTGTCINSTEGGAYIPGTQVMPFQEAIDNHVNQCFYPLDIIKNRLSFFTRDNTESENLRTITLIDSTITDMQHIIGHCQNGFEIYEKYRAELEQCLQKQYIPEKLFKQLSRMETEIMMPKTKCHIDNDSFQLFFAHVIQSFTLNFEMVAASIPGKYENFDLARIDIMLRQSEWYTVIADLANICIKALQNAREKINNEKYL